MSMNDKFISILKNDMPIIYEQNKLIIDNFCEIIDPKDILHNNDIDIGLFYYVLADACCEDAPDENTFEYEEYCDLIIHLYTLSIQYSMTYGYRLIAMIYSFALRFCFNASLQMPSV